MIYNQFISKTTKYLKSVRILKNYISFDMIFPSTWLMLKKQPEGIEFIQTEGNEGQIITSFVCENKKELIDLIENTIDSFIKTNIEREEKEKLFKNKVQELKGIFEKENLNSLKSLKFDIEELTQFISSNGKEIDNGSTKTDKSS